MDNIISTCTAPTEVQNLRLHRKAPGGGLRGDWDLDFLLESTEGHDAQKLLVLYLLVDARLLRLEPPRGLLRVGIQRERHPRRKR